MPVCFPAGVFVGCLVGTGDGRRKGCTLGWPNSWRDGCSEGWRDGCQVGGCDGYPEGWRDGCQVGGFEGDPEGWRDGCPVGCCVGGCPTVSSDPAWSALGLETDNTTPQQWVAMSTMTTLIMAIRKLCMVGV